MLNLKLKIQTVSIKPPCLLVIFWVMNRMCVSYVFEGCLGKNREREKEVFMN